MEGREGRREGKGRKNEGEGTGKLTGRKEKETMKIKINGIAWTVFSPGCEEGLLFTCLTSNQSLNIE